MVCSNYEKLGAKLEHVVLSHVDRAKEVEYNRAVLDVGVKVEYDSAFRWKPEELNHTLHLLENLLPQYPNQITMGMDMAKNTYWKSYGGSPGLTYLLKSIPAYLASKELSEHFNNIFYSNPKELFSFSSK